MAKINELLGSLRSTYLDWSAYLSNPRFIRNDMEVTWSNRAAGIRKEIIRESHVIEMANAGQYSFQVLKDGSLIQLYYRFDRSGTRLISASLAYFHVEPRLQGTQGELLLDELGVLPIDTKIGHQIGEDFFNGPEMDNPAAWFRIDYAPEAQERGVTHHDGHMHLSSFPNTRLIVNGIPSPGQFIELVFASCYPDEYKTHRLSLENGSKGAKKWVHTNTERLRMVNSLCHPLPDDIVYKILPHIHVPTTTA